MDLQYSVHNVSAQTRPGVAPIEGSNLSVIIPEIEVELSDPSGKQGSITLHFRTPAEQAYALATFVPGETVTIGLPGALITPVVEPVPEPDPVAV